MEKYVQHIGIKAWAEEDRPREKFMLKGRLALSDAELLAIIIGTGIRDESAVDVAKKILSSLQGNLNELAKQSILDLKKHKGLGEAKAINILAALELGKRRSESLVIEKGKIATSKDASEIFRNTLADQPFEEFWILMLNRGNRLIRKQCISEGGISGTVVDPKKIFKVALDHYASSIILGHNHPSGNLQPSEADIRITRKIKEAGQLLEISVLDHLIISDAGFYSFADEGLL